MYVTTGDTKMYPCLLLSSMFDSGFTSSRFSNSSAKTLFSITFLNPQHHHTRFIAKLSKNNCHDRTSWNLHVSMVLLSEPPPKPAPFPGILQLLSSRLYSTDKHSDLEPICKDRNYNLHRFVICTWFPIFEHMLGGSFQVGPVSLSSTRWTLAGTIQEATMEIL